MAGKKISQVFEYSKNTDLLWAKYETTVRNFLFSVEKLHDFNSNSSGSFPNILSSAKIGELYLLGTSDALLLLTPSGEIKTLWQDCPVYKIVSNEHFVFFIRGVEREFGFMRIESIRKNFAKINKGTALFNPLGQILKFYRATCTTAPRPCSIIPV